MGFRLWTLALAAVLAAAPMAASAQPYPYRHYQPYRPQSYPYPQDQGEDEQDQETRRLNLDQLQQPEGSYDKGYAYEDQRRRYRRQRAYYEARREAYERSSADYNERWGPGAYQQRYGPPRGYDSTEYDPYPTDRGRRGGNAGGTGNVIGGLASGALGIGLAAHPAVGLGVAILGGLACGLSGNAIAWCDDGGDDHPRDETFPDR